MTNIRDKKALFFRSKSNEISGRYITLDHIESLIKNLDQNFNIKIFGKSVLGAPIYSVKFGNGTKKVLIWSQMHGNESTTTKALFDMFNAISLGELNWLLNQCTLFVIPMLNPDGARTYKRFNANEVDLNRDAQTLSQPESRILRQAFEEFKPNYCFNLHGQRTIFSAGDVEKSAIVSFLSPAQDRNCTITDTRKISMSIIWKMNEALQKLIPDGVGKYDDSFNLNCVGDTFQSLGVPTILFEAGHYPNDYTREKTRELIFISCLKALETISNEDISRNDYLSYQTIPENRKLFYDIVIRNAYMKGKNVSIAIQFQEKLVDGKVNFIPKVEKIGKIDRKYGHKYVDANNNDVLTTSGQPIFEGYENDIVLINNEEFSLKP